MRGRVYALFAGRHRRCFVYKHQLALIKANRRDSVSRTRESRALPAEVAVATATAIAVASAAVEAALALTYQPT